MSFDFTGKKVLVTGAGRNIGRGIAEALVKAGCKVFALDIDAELLATLKAEYPDVTTIVVDLSNWENTRREVEKLETMDGLVNNAGIVAPAMALDASKEDLAKCLAVNTLAAINIMQVVCKKMIADKKPGSVVNIASIAGIKCFTGVLPYSLSKTGLDMVTKQFALELGPYNIRCNTVHPSLVMTDMTRQMIDRGSPLVEIILERSPIPRILEVKDVAGPVLYLLSDLSAMVTGTQHIVDGGVLCNITTKL